MTQLQRHFKIGKNDVPHFLYGTAWKEDDTTRCVEDAIRAGFRGIDTANQRKHYFEAGVGRALQQIYASTPITRKDLFLQTKFTSLGGQDNRLPFDPEANATTQVQQSFSSSLEHLGTDYLDSYVLHGPSAPTKLSDHDWEVWRAMESLADSGKTKLIGISNVQLSHLQDLLHSARVKPAFVQNRCFARIGWDFEIRKLCKEHNIVYQGFSLLSSHNLQVLKTPEFAEIVRRTERTPAQIIFRFAIQVGMLPLTGTTNAQHMREDLVALEFALPDEDVKTIELMAGLS
ncbi:MAG: aldo/keto reductase family protein [Oligoflexales bacterium]